MVVAHVYKSRATTIMRTHSSWDRRTTDRRYHNEKDQRVDYLESPRGRRTMREYQTMESIKQFLLTFYLASLLISTIQSAASTASTGHSKREVKSSQPADFESVSPSTMSVHFVHCGSVSRSVGSRSVGSRSVGSRSVSSRPAN